VSEQYIIISDFVWFYQDPKNSV